MRRTRLLTLVPMTVATLLLAGCGGSADGDSDSVTGTHPFSTWERCYDGWHPDDGGSAADHRPDELPPGCSDDSGANPLRAGATLLGGDTAPFDVGFRGAATVRGDTTDSANPEYVEVYVVLDITVVGDRSMHLRSSGFDSLSVQARIPGTSGPDLLSDCSAGAAIPTARHGVDLRQGESLTMAFCRRVAAPAAFLDGDVRLTVSSGADNAATLAADRGIPAAAFADVRSSIERMQQDHPGTGGDWGAGVFEARYGELADGLETEDRRGAGPGADDQGGPGAGGDLPDGFPTDEAGEWIEGHGPDLGDPADPGAQGSDRVEAGRQDGYSFGYERGHDAAEAGDPFDDEFVDGRGGWYTHAHDPTYTRAFDQGYAQGYADGYADGGGSGANTPSTGDDDCPPGMSAMEC